LIKILHQNANKVTRPSIRDTSRRSVGQEHVSSSREESEPTRATRAEKGKGKMTAIVESDDEVWLPFCESELGSFAL
jgi:hypothetical protein